jgi:FkbM family methyltransferase
MRAATYHFQEHSPFPREDLNAKYTDRVFTIKAALGEEEGVVDFNEGAGPACSSLLEKSNTSNFWCINTRRKIRVNKFTLESFLQLLPPRIKSIHLKVDAEGADHLVLRGAGDAIHRLTTIAIECQDLPPEKRDQLLFQGACLYDEIQAYLCKVQKICNAHSIVQNELINAFFLPSNLDKVDIPNFLLHSDILFSDWYRSIARNATR